MPPPPLPSHAASADPTVAIAASASSGSSFNPLAALEGNPYFSAGFGLGIMGAGLAALRGAGKAAVTLAKRHMLVTLEVTSKDRAYPWVLNWLTEKAQHTSLGQHMSVQTVVKKLANGRTTTSFEFLPSTGTHVVSYNGHLVMVDRVREQQTVDLQTGQPWECVKLTAFGRERSLFQFFLSEAHTLSLAKQEATTTIYTNWGTEWRPFGSPRRRRPLHSVVLDDGIAEHLVGDLHAFVGSSQWYIDRGIPYRRGYLLHGGPGCGKSSFVAAIAGEIGYDICVLNLSDAGLTDDRLSHALSAVPPQALVLLEDIDAAFVQRDANDRRIGVTFSGLLNALDGVAAGEERILFMTTNHLDRLDPALVRPGRVDVMHYVGPATPSQLRRMFLKFFPAEETHAERFVAALSGSELSMALLQSYFMLYRDSAEQASAASGELARRLQGATPPQQVLSDLAMELGRTPVSTGPEPTRCVSGVTAKA